MSGNLKLKPTADYTTMGGPAIGELSPGGREAEMGAGALSRLKPGISSLVTTWVSLSVTMILVFLLGFYLGRQHGVKVALDGQPDGAARLPLIPQSVAVKEAESLALSSPSIGSPAIGFPAGVAPSTGTGSSLSPGQPQKREQSGRNQEPNDLAANAAAPQTVPAANAGSAKTEQAAAALNSAVAAPAPGAVAAAGAPERAHSPSILLAEQKIDFTQTAPLAGTQTQDGTAAAGTGTNPVSAKSIADTKTPALKTGNEKELAAANSAYNSAGFGTKTALSASEIGKTGGTGTIAGSAEKNTQTAAASRLGKTPVSAENRSSLETRAAAAESSDSLAVQALSGESVSAKKSAAIKTADKLSNGWYIQIAAKTDQKEAAVLVKQLAASKVQSRIEQGIVRGTTYYRVVAGPFKSRDAAAPTMKRVRGSGAVSTEPFLKQVK